MLIKRKNCCFCGSIDLINIFSLSYRNKNLSNFLNTYYSKRLPIKKIKKFKYNLLKCLKCTGIFQENIPNKNFMFNLYNKYICDKESLKKKENLYNKNLRKYFIEAKLIKKIFNKNPRNISILEFGAGWGFWAQFMKSLNFKIKCFEISNKRISYMKKNKLQVIKNISKLNEKFDFIYSDQTLEHLPNPKEVLEIFDKLLKKGGYIFLEFPSSFLFEYKLNKNYIPKKDCAHPLEHINLINRKSLNCMITSTSLKIINFKNFLNFSFKQVISDFVNLFIFKSLLLKK
jgi:2-polyprenyl-3-methyl-5-hydroxy-6-metoxy-1,4-benzoquinol methylase